ARLADLLLEPRAAEASPEDAPLVAEAIRSRAIAKARRDDSGDLRGDVRTQKGDLARLGRHEAQQLAPTDLVDGGLADVRQLEGWRDDEVVAVGAEGAHELLAKGQSLVRRRRQQIAHACRRRQRDPRDDRLRGAEYR